MVNASAGIGGGGRYIDHNDRLGEGILGNGFEETKRIWRVEYREGEVPLMRGWWWVLTRRKLGGRKAESGQIDTTRAANGGGVVGDEEKKSNSEGEDEDVENSSSATPATGNDIQKDLGKDDAPSIPPTEDPEDWDEDGKYAICCCWNCEVKRDMQEEAGRSKNRKWGAGKWKGNVEFTRQEEWRLRAIVHYYRTVEAARNEGRMLPVWKIREPWAEKR